MFICGSPALWFLVICLVLFASFSLFSGRASAFNISVFQHFSISAFPLPLSSLIYLLPLAWLWFRLIDHLRLEWAVNPQYTYGWAVPFLCLYLIWRKAESRKQKAEIPNGKSQLGGSSGPVSAFQQASLPSTANPQASTINHQPPPVRGPSSALPFLLSAFRISALNSGFSFSAFQLFSFFLLCFLYLPTRLIQEANPEWRLVSWALALEVVALTLLVLRTIDYGPLTKDHGPEARDHVSRFTFHAPRFTFHVSRFTPHVSRFTFPILFFLVAVPWPTLIEGPLVQGLMRANVGVTTELLSAFGVPAVPHGNVIEIANGMVGIDDACSGIRSFQATLMISLFLGELYALTVCRRVLCVLAGFALSFLFNVARTTLLTWVAAHKGSAAIASWHDPAGVTILVACFLSIWALAWVLRRQVALGRASVPASPGPVLEAGLGSRGRSPSRGSLVPSARSPVVSSPVVSGPVVSGPVVSSPVVSGPVVSSPVVSSPVVSSPVVSSQWSVVSCSLLVWLLVVEAGTETWYRSHEWGVAKAATWQVEFPRENVTFRELPFSDKTRQFLRYDEGENGTWQEGADQRWQAIFLRWNPGRIAVHLAKSHTPEVCLTAAGHELVSQSGLRPVAVQGLQLPFRSYVVRDESGPVHVFYCLWEDRAYAQAFRTTMMTYGNRLAPVLAGRRNSGQRSLEVAIWGIADQEAADAALARELDKLIRVGEQTGDYGPLTKDQ